jgi:hypothetical protein
MGWAGGVTLLSLMSWLNMPSEIMCLLDFTHGLLEVNAMDDRGATPLMCMFLQSRLIFGLSFDGRRGTRREFTSRATPGEALSSK